MRLFDKSVIRDAFGGQPLVYLRVVAYLPDVNVLPKSSYAQKLTP